MRQMVKVVAVGLALGHVAEPGRAQDAPPPFPEVNFRRVTPPEPGFTGRRINIQIEPAPVAEPVVAAPPEPDADTGPSGWFWSAVPSTREAPGREDAALSHLAHAPEVADLGLARLEDLDALAALHGRDILAATVGTDVSPALVLAVIAVESSGRPDAVSDAGAQGLMQLIPATAERFSVADPFDPAENIAGGVAYLDWLLREFDGDALLALAGYNAGEGAVHASGGVPNYAETRAYVPKVLATWDIARLLCATPPDFLADGCVFTSLARG